MLLHSLVLSLSLLSLFNAHGMKRTITHDDVLCTDQILTLASTDSLLFAIPPELLAKIIACCDPHTRNKKLMRTNQYLRFYASRENSDVILICSPLQLSCPNERKRYMKFYICEDKVEILKNLLANGANPNEITDPNYSALDLAILKNSIKSAKFLIEETDIDVNENRGYDQSCPLYFAAYKGRLEIVQHLLHHKKIDTKKTFNGGRTACHTASQRGNLGVVKLLLDHDATLLNMPCIYGSTPLYVAAQEGQIKTVEFLLTRKEIQVNSRFRIGYVPLHIASEKGHLEVVSLLLDHKDILINATADDGYTALYAATQHGCDEVVKLLLAHPDIDVNIKNNNGWTALHIASDSGHAAVVNLFIIHDANLVNTQTEEGQTPLHIACTNRHFKIVEALLTSPYISATINAVFQECTALDIALDLGDRYIEKLLIANGGVCKSSLL